MKLAFNPTNETRREILRPPIIKLTGKPGEIVSAVQRAALKAQDEISNVKVLKPIPHKLRPLGKKVEYYIELWKIGAEDKIANVVKTANIKNLMRLILSTKKYSVTYISRTSDGKVLWDKPYQY